MEIPIQVAVRIYPHRELKNLVARVGSTQEVVDKEDAEHPKDTGEEASEEKPPQITDKNGNAGEDTPALGKLEPETDANGNENGTAVNSRESGYCVQAIPISASALGLPSALPGGDPMDSIAAGLIQVGPHTVPVTHALASSSTQEQVYHQTVFPLIGLFLEGFDASVVTYGQSGQGKSYTLYGNIEEGAQMDGNEGVVQLCVRDIFAHISTHPGGICMQI